MITVVDAVAVAVAVADAVVVFVWIFVSAIERRWLGRKQWLVICITSR